MSSTNSVLLPGDAFRAKADYFHTDVDDFDRFGGGAPGGALTYKISPAPNSRVSNWRRPTIGAVGSPRFRVPHRGKNPTK